jgi:hypothetical protein
MRPVDCFAAIGDILTRTVGSPYREKEMSDSEWDSLVAQIEMLAEKEKADGHPRTETARSKG